MRNKITSKQKTRKSKLALQLAGIFLFSLCLLFGYFLFSRGFFLESSLTSPIPADLSNKKDTNQDGIKNLTAKLKKNNISFASISSFSEGGFFIKLGAGEEIILSSQKNIDVQISSLQLILSRLTIEGKRFSRLDFRFDKPVITLR